MTGLTALIAAFSSVLALVLPPVYSIIVYLAVLAWYPSSLTISVASVDFTASRILALVIVLSLALRPSEKGFKFILLDKLVITFFVCQLIAGFNTASTMLSFIENRAGAMFDLMLPYFMIRLAVKSKDDYLTILKWLMVIAAPMAVLGFYQAVTGNNVAEPLLAHASWGATELRDELRYGFHRASVTFPVHILFGLYFVMCASLCAGLYYNIKKYKIVYIGGMLLLGLGVFSSMSSGPLLGAILSIMIIGFYRWRRYAKFAILAMIAMCLFIEVVSNRHFYDVLSGMAMNNANAWYRSELINVAIYKGGMADHWLFGYGHDVDPGWGPMIDGRELTDIVNHYLILLSRFGVIALIAFIAVNICAIKSVIKAYKRTRVESERWIVWCLGSGMFALSGVFVTVSLFGQPRTLYYMMLAFCGIMPRLVTSHKRSRLKQRRRKQIIIDRYIEVDAGDMVGSIV